jgi:hypothetical protein
VTLPIHTLLMAAGGGADGGIPAANLWAHYDASDAASISATSGRVDQWNDLSGNGFHLTSSAGSRPFTGTRTANGLNVLDFQGGQHIRLSAAVGFVTGTFTLYVVWGADTHMDNGGVIQIHNSGATSDFNTVNAVVSTSSAFAGGSAREWLCGLNSVFNVAGTPSATSAFGTYTTRKNTTGDGLVSVTPSGGTDSDVTTATGTANGGILVGARWSGGAVGANFLDGPVAEILIYTARHDNTTVTSTRATLIAKWGA